MNKHFLIYSLFLALVLVPACQQKMEGPDASEITYPDTKKADQVDDYFGTKVADPYRWLEDDNAEDVKAWVDAQNNVTFNYLEQIPYRRAIKNRLMELYNYPKYSSPFKAGDYYFFYKNDGLQNQSVIYIQKGLDGEPEVFIDPNQLSPDGTIRIHIAGISNDDKYVAIMRSEAGSDWREIRVMEIASKKELDDRIRWVKFSGTSWYKDGFFYNRYSEPLEEEKLKAQNRDMKVYYHKLEQSQEQDTLIYEDPEKGDIPVSEFWDDFADEPGNEKLDVFGGTYQPSGYNWFLTYAMLQSMTDDDPLILPPSDPAPTPWAYWSVLYYNTAHAQNTSFLATTTSAAEGTRPWISARIQYNESAGPVVPPFFFLHSFAYSPASSLYSLQSYLEDVFGAVPANSRCYFSVRFRIPDGRISSSIDFSLLPGESYSYTAP